jgi:DNA-binding response OmpR family regulator
MNNRNRKRLLLVDKQAEYRHSLRSFLELDGYDLAESETPEEALHRLATEEFDLVLAELRMGDEDDPHDIGGIEIAKFASELNVPCIIVTAFPTVELARITLRARGGTKYAHDLVAKSSGPQAIIDAISSILDSNHLGSGRSDEKGIKLDWTRKLVWKDGELLQLARNEYLLLETLFKRDGGLCSHAELLHAIFGEELPEQAARNDRRIQHLVDRTKDKIEDKDAEDEYLKVVPGRGYLLNLKN